MIKQRTVAILVGLGVSALLSVAGCVHTEKDSGNMRNTTGIDIGVQNIGTKRIENASVAFGDYRFTFGIIAPGKKAVHVCSEQIVPENAEIEFEIEDGRQFKKTVAVKKHLPKTPVSELVLHFNIDDKQQVHVEFLHFIQIDGRSKLVPY